MPQRNPTLGIPGFRSVADWIRYELSLRENYPYGLWRRYISLLERLAKVPPESLPSYKSFWRTIYLLNQLGLIRKVRVERQKGKPPRSYYAVVRERIDDPLWFENPQRVVARMRGWRPTWLGRRRYRRRVLGLPPLPRGRPRKGSLPIS